MLPNPRRKKNVFVSVCMSLSLLVYSVCHCLYMSVCVSLVSVPVCGILFLSVGLPSFECVCLSLSKCLFECLCCLLVPVWGIWPFCLMMSVFGVWVCMCIGTYVCMLVMVSRKF